MATQTVPASDQKSQQNAPAAKDWTKPAAMAIPKEGYFREKMDDMAQSFPGGRRRATASRLSQRLFREEKKPVMSTEERWRRQSPDRPTVSRSLSSTTCDGFCFLSKAKPT